MLQSWARRQGNLRHAHIKHFSLSLKALSAHGWWFMRIQVPPTSGGHLFLKTGSKHTRRHWGWVSQCLKCQRGRSLPLIGPKKSRNLVVVQTENDKNTTDCKWALRRHDHIFFQRTDTSFRVWKREKKTEERWQIDNETAKSLILRIICFFCSMASSGETVNQRLERNKLCSKILFPKHLRLGGREQQREKIQLFSSFITSLVTNKTRFTERQHSLVL